MPTYTVWLQVVETHIVRADNEQDALAKALEYPRTDVEREVRTSEVSLDEDE